MRQITFLLKLSLTYMLWGPGSVPVSILTKVLFPSHEVVVPVGLEPTTPSM